MHLDPGCTGYWSPCPEAIHLTCSGCGASFEPTPEQLVAALQENHAGLVAVRLTDEGASLGRRPDRPSERRRRSQP